MAPSPMLSFLRRCLVALPLLVPPVAAQQVLVVDIAGGPGSQFTQIGPAVQAAEPGATILVRPGVYSNQIRITKPVRIFGVPRQVVLRGTGDFTISGIGAGESVLLRGIDEDYSQPFFYGILARNCAGSITCEDVDIEAMSFSSCASVALVHCDLALNLYVTASNATIVDCTANACCFLSVPQQAVVIQGGSHVTIAGGTYTSGDVTFPNSTVAVDASRLVVTGDRNTFLGLTPGSAGGSSILMGNGAAVLLDPEPQLPNGWSGAGTVTQRVVPFLRAGVENDTLHSTLVTWPNASTFLLVGALGAPIAVLPDTTPLWLPAPVVLASGPAPAAGVRIDTFPLPPLPLGTTVALQSLAIRGPDAALSNATSAVLEFWP